MLQGSMNISCNC